MESRRNPKRFATKRKRSASVESSASWVPPSRSGSPMTLPQNSPSPTRDPTLPGSEGHTSLKATKSRRAPKKTDPTIIISLDFGTTFTGGAWARSSKPNHVNIITNWESQLWSNSDENKVPTCLSYKNGEVSSWGYDVPSNEIAVRLFKLLLLNESDVPDHLRDSSQMNSAKLLLETTGKSVIEVISDYIREVWKHSLENIKKSIGRQMVELSRFQIVVTVPAIWPMYAQSRMEEAIKLAGILGERAAGNTTVTFISEPEAAALATMDDMSGREDIQENDHFVVCDAGGGTVDIITYEVVETEPLMVRESVRGAGRLCGAMFLDDGFNDLLRLRTPSEIFKNISAKGIYQIRNDYWEHGIKPNFKDDGRSWEIRLPKGDEITLDNADILSVYKPVTSEIVDLVWQQIRQVRKIYNKCPKYVMLVGGFGKSRYLYQHLGKALGDRVEVLQADGERPWTAVCRGAVIKGLTEGQLSSTLSVPVFSRIARRSYGTLCNLWPWEATEHHPDDKEWSQIDGQWLAVDQTAWFIRIGSSIPEGEPFEIYDRYQFVKDPNEEILTEIVYSDILDPPNRCDEDVKQLCIIRWSKIPSFESLPIKKVEKGEEYRQVDYNVQMVTKGASMEFSIMYKGEKVASENIDVNFNESGHTARPGRL